MLLAPGLGTVAFDAIVQEMNFTLDASAAPALRMASVNVLAVLPLAQMQVATGAAYAGDAGLGRWTFFNLSGSPAVTSQNKGLVFDSLDFTSPPLLPASYGNVLGTPFVLTYIVPRSATLTPASPVFQTFGQMTAVDVAPGGPYNIGAAPSAWSYTDAWFSAGIATVPGAIPVAGLATYGGKLNATVVDAASRDLAQVDAGVNLVVNFAARSVAFATISSTSLSVNAAAGAARSASTMLNLTGTLSYAPGSNTFSGVVTSASGLTGNATCRFYGPGIGAATFNKVVGSPDEVGCTFAVVDAAKGAMQGALSAHF